MGYYGEYFSTLFKGTGAMAFKERWNVRKTVKNLSRASKTLYTDLPTLIEKQHKVSSAMEKERKALKQLKEASESTFKLLLEAEMQEHTMFQEFEKVADALGNVKGASAHVQKIESNLVSHVLSILDKGEEGNRLGYKDLIAVMDQATQGEGNLRQALRLRFQKLDSESFLARVAARGEIGDVKKSINKLSRAAKTIAKLKGKDAREIEQILPGVLEEVEHAAREGITESLLIKKRAIIWIMKVLYDLDSADELGVKYANVHFMPAQFSSEIKSHTKETRKDVLGHFRTIAQGFRIGIASLDSAKSKFKKAA